MNKKIEHLRKEIENKKNGNFRTGKKKFIGCSQEHNGDYKERDSESDYQNNRNDTLKNREEKC